MSLTKTILIGVGIVILSTLIFFSSNLTGFVASNLDKTEFSMLNFVVIIAGLMVVFFLIKKY